MPKSILLPLLLLRFSLKLYLIFLYARSLQVVHLPAATTTNVTENLFSRTLASTTLKLKNNNDY